MQYLFQNSTLPLEARVKNLLSLLTIEEKIHMLSTHQLSVPRLNIGEWFIGTEAARGYVSREPDEFSTVFPQPIGLASTFDPLLMESIGEITGIEARYFQRKDPKSHLMLWGPTVDPERDPRWGRTEEGYGEDPFLIGEMTAAYTRGMAGDDPTYRRTIPTLKHFCANNQETHRIDSSSNVTPRTLHEYYYRPFKAAIVHGGAGSMMTAYNELNGVPACMNPDLQTVVKDQWHLGFVVTDGADFSQNVLSHHSHQTHGDALAACLKNGCDILTDNVELVAAAARDALSQRKITEADIDRAVGNALLGRFRLGEFDGDNCPYNTEPTETDTPLHRLTNYIAAAEQMCLLHNTGILPLSKKNVRTIAVIGPLGAENYRDWYAGTASYAVSILKALQNMLGAEHVLFDDGCDIVGLQSVQTKKFCSISTDGTLTVSADTIGSHETFWLHDWDFGCMNLRACCNKKYVTENNTYRAESDQLYAWFIKEWFKPEKYGKDYVFHSWHDKKMDIALQADGTLRAVKHGRPSADKLFHFVQIEDGIQRAAKLAEKADVVILCVGNHPMQVARECYDRPNLELPQHQKELIRAVQSANPNTVLTVVASYPYALCEEKETLPAILYTTHAGAELGNAVADTLFGKNNPAARCPITWYKTAQDLPDLFEYDIIDAERTYLYDTAEPLFPFGHGLSYAKFVYHDFQAKLVESGVLFHMQLENTSDLDGDEVVQIYTHALHSRVKRPNKQLCGFRRICVPAKTRVPLTIFVPWYALEYYDVTQERMLVEKGLYQFWAAASSTDFRLELQLDLPGEVIPPRNLAQEIHIKNYDEKDGIDTHLWFSMQKNDWYGCTNDWGGTFTFLQAAFLDYTTAEILAAAPCEQATLQIFADELCLGEVTLPPARCADDFQSHTIALQPFSGIANLHLQIQGMASVYSIRFS